MPGFFITATGTNIGKTFVTAALIHQLKAASKPVHAIKPVISGYEPGQYDSDLSVLCEALGDISLEHISHYRFKEPVSPHLAADRENRTIDFAELTGFCNTHLAQTGTVLIEGAGGVMSPLTNDKTNLDLITALGIPAILVTGTYLGTLSHTLTAIAVMRERGVSPHAIIVSASDCPEDALADTVTSLRQFAPDIHRIFALPRVESWKAAPSMLQCLA